MLKYQSRNQSRITYSLEWPHQYYVHTPYQWFFYLFLVAIAVPNKVHKI